MRTAFARTAISCLNIVLRQARDLGAVLPLSEDEASVPSGLPSGGLFLMQLTDSSMGTFLVSAVLFGRSPGCGAFAERLQTKKTTTISDRGQSVKIGRASCR